MHFLFAAFVNTCDPYVLLVVTVGDNLYRFLVQLGSIGGNLIYGGDDLIVDPTQVNACLASTVACFDIAIQVVFLDVTPFLVASAPLILIERQGSYSIWATVTAPTPTLPLDYLKSYLNRF